eukprot:TRINITY_DN26984_c0_g1_i1.p1 TRINITY_DN26984_c0_g1~~TRINITY_DN26984_c0_g1_i1.p1  ORF type:complete len:354 (-),score=38.02 TRINITY_DN26984_c0_g1_i1:83-1144(-)
MQTATSSIARDAPQQLSDSRADIVKTLGRDSFALSVVGVGLCCIFWGAYSHGGAVVGALAVGLGAFANLLKPELSSRTTCAPCCICCPDCGMLTNAWHLRNVTVVLIFASFAVLLQPLSAGLHYALQDNRCHFTCMYAHFEKCGLCTYRHSSKVAESVMETCCHDADDWETVSSKKKEQGKNLQEASKTEQAAFWEKPNVYWHPMCTPIDCNLREGSWDDDHRACVSLCECMGGILKGAHADNQEECWLMEAGAGLAAVVTSVGLVAVMVLATALQKGLNLFIVTDGLQGRPLAFAGPLHDFPPPAMLAGGTAGVVIGSPVSVAGNGSMTAVPALPNIEVAEDEHARRKLACE